MTHNGRDRANDPKRALEVAQRGAARPTQSFVDQSGGERERIMTEKGIVGNIAWLNKIANRLEREQKKAAGEQGNIERNTEAGKGKSSVNVKKGGGGTGASDNEGSRGG